MVQAEGKKLLGAVQYYMDTLVTRIRSIVSGSFKLNLNVWWLTKIRMNMDDLLIGLGYQLGAELELKTFANHLF